MQPNILKRYKAHICVFLFYFLIALVITFPLAIKLDSHVPVLFRSSTNDDICDADGGLWMYWWAKATLFKSTPFFTNLQFYPTGKDLLSHIGGFLNPIISIPWQYLFGLVVSYNIIILFSISLAGYGMYLLVNYLIKDKIIALISGFVFLFNPLFLFIISKGLTDQMAMGWIPIYILYLLKTSAGRGIKNILFSAALLSLVFFSCFDYGMFLVIFTVLFIFSIIYRQGKLTINTLRRIFLVIFLFILIISPYFYFFIKSLLSGSFTYFSQLKLPLWGNIIFDNQSGFVKCILGASLDISSFLSRTKESFSPSFIVIFLFFLSLFIIKEKPKFWIFLVFFFFILSLGPYLKMGGKIQFTQAKILIPLPYITFYNFVPFFPRFHWPHRFLVMMYLCLAVISGYSLKGVFSRLRLRRYQLLLGWLVIIFIVLETWLCALAYFPLKLRKISIPSYYYKLAQEEDCAIIEYPISYYANRAAKYTFYQTFHHKKLLEGMTADFLFPPDHKKFLGSNAFLRYLIQLQENSQYLAEFDKEDNIRGLRNLGFKYLVVHSYDFDLKTRDTILEKLRQILGTPKVYEEGIVVYKI